jgi:hypothetical protein
MTVVAVARLQCRIRVTRVGTDVCAREGHATFLCPAPQSMTQPSHATRRMHAMVAGKRTLAMSQHMKGGGVVSRPTDQQHGARRTRAAPVKGL